MLKKSASQSSEVVESTEDEKISNQSGTSSLDRKVDRRICGPYRFPPPSKGCDDATTNDNDRYVSMTNEQHDSEDKCDWVRANMIDFTHVFPADDDGSLDLNYLEGIDNLFKLMETFLVQSRKGLDNPRILAIL